MTAGLALSAAQPLGARCADGRAQELAGAIAAAGNGAAPAGGAAAAAVLRELHRLGSADAADGPPGEDAGAGAGAVAAEAAEAAAVLAAVQRGAEPAPRGVLQHLDGVLAAVRGGGVEVTPDARASERPADRLLARYCMIVNVMDGAALAPALRRPGVLVAAALDDSSPVKKNGAHIRAAPPAARPGGRPGDEAAAGAARRQRRRAERARRRRGAAGRAQRPVAQRARLRRAYAGGALSGARRLAATPGARACPTGAAGGGIRRRRLG